MSEENPPCIALDDETFEDFPEVKSRKNKHSSMVLPYSELETTSIDDAIIRHYALYKELFGKGESIVVFKETDIDFKNIDDYLKSCLSTLDADGISFEDCFLASFTNLDLRIVSSTKAKYYYSHDKLTYLATLEVGVHSTNGKKFSALYLRLFNDGFMYRFGSKGHMSVRQTKVPNHNSTGWDLLDAIDLNQFPTAVCFAGRLLGISRPSCKLYYNADDQRMDLKFRNGDRMVYLQFEQGFPVNDFDDDWY